MQLICVGIVNSAGRFFIRSEFLRLFLMSAQIGRKRQAKNSSPAVSCCLYPNAVYLFLYAV